MPTPRASFAEWSDALYFATQHNLTKARLYITDTLEPAGCLLRDNPTAVIQLADRCKVNAPWLLPQYVALCERTDPLSDDEAGRLTVPDFAAISRIREKRATLEAQRKGAEEARTACCCGKPRPNPSYSGTFNRNRRTHFGGGYNKGYDNDYDDSPTIPACACVPYTFAAMPNTADMIKDEPYLTERTSFT